MNTAEPLSMLHSVVTAVDGPAKAGTTAIINRIGEAAQNIETRFSTALENNIGAIAAGQRKLPLEVAASYAVRHQLLSFDRVAVIPGGNFFRAAGLFAIEREEQGRPIDTFADVDTAVIHEILARPGVQDVLDHDPRIKARVSGIIRDYAGAHALCSTMLCEAIADSYRPGVGTLTIVDARNPVNHMRASEILGFMPGEVDQNSVVPLYVETPVADAASRLSGDPEENAVLIEARRRMDAERPDDPVVVPGKLEADKLRWRMRFVNLPPTGLADPLLFRNDRSVTFDDLDDLARYVAQTAREVGEKLYARKLWMQTVDPELNLIPGTRRADLQKA